MTHSTSPRSTSVFSGSVFSGLAFSGSAFSGSVFSVHAAAHPKHGWKSPNPLRGVAWILVGAAFCFLSGCDKKQEPQPAAVPASAPSEAVPSDPHSGSPHATPPAARAQTPAPAAIEVVWDAPDSWKEMPPRMMRKATYRMDGTGGPAELAVFYFGEGQGGSVEANIARWIGQFEGLGPDAQERSEEMVGGFKHTRVEIERGTYNGGMPGQPSTPQKDFAMSATIVETPAGPYFFKMTGPAQTVAEQKENFMALLSSVRAAK